METSDRVLIIGGGITGTAAAYELARSGVSVTVVERASLASMGSGRTLAGVRQSGRHPAELPLAISAVQRWQTLGEELGADLEYRQRGNLRLAEDEADVEKLREMVQDHQGDGLEIEFLENNSAVREIAPAVSERILAAAYCPTDGHANPIATVQAYAAAGRRCGVCFMEQTPVRDITTSAGRVTGVTTDQGPIAADQIVVAAGIDTPRLLEPLGLDFPLSLALVPVIQTVGTRQLLDQVLGTAKAHFAARQQVDGRMRFSSGGHPVDLRPSDVTVESMRPTVAMAAETLSRAAELLPEIAEVPVNQIWGGFVDLTSDGIPVLDRVPEIEGLVVAAGFSGHGFCLGPVSGEIVRDLVLDRSSRWPLDPFRWRRSLAQSQTRRAELHG